MSTVISMDYLRTLTNAINGLTDAGKRAVEAQVRAIIARNDGVGIVDLVDEILEAIEPYLETVAQNAASLSAQSYDLIRYEAVDSTLGATPYTGRVPEATRKAVRGIAEYHSQNTEAFVHELLNRVDYEAKRAAGQTTFENGKDDPKRPRYARVPTGPETCRFCVMLASRGFVYHSEKTAGALNHFHPNCDCRIIPGFEGMAVDGYDPDEYLRLWQEMEDEGIEKISAARSETPSAPTGIDRSAPVYAGLESEYVDELDGIFGDAPEANRRLYKRFEGDFALTSDGSKAYFDPKDVRVRLDVDVVLGDKGSGPKVKGDTWFHEFGHSIDYMSTGTDDLYAKLGRMTRDRKSGHGHSSMYASVAYKDNLFGKTLQKEVSARVKAQWDKLKDEKRDLISLFDTLDFDTMHMRGYITVRERDRLKQMLRTSREFAEIRGTDPRDELMATSTVKNLIDGYAKKERAYERLSEEIFYLPHAHNGAISDIFEGVTKCKVSDFWGHGKAYWKNQQNVPIEAFAEFYSAEMVDPDAVSLIEVYFPESKKVFDDLVGALAEGVDVWQT